MGIMDELLKRWGLKTSRDGSPPPPSKPKPSSDDDDDDFARERTRTSDNSSNLAAQRQREEEAKKAKELEEQDKSKQRIREIFHGPKETYEEMLQRMAQSHKRPEKERDRGQDFGLER